MRIFYHTPTAADLYWTGARWRLLGYFLLAGLGGVAGGALATVVAVAVGAEIVHALTVGALARRVAGVAAAVGAEVARYAGTSAPSTLVLDARVPGPALAHASWPPRKPQRAIYREIAERAEEPA